MHTKIKLNQMFKTPILCCCIGLFTVFNTNLFAQKHSNHEFKSDKYVYSSFNALLKSQFMPLVNYNELGELYLQETRFLELNYQRMNTFRSRWNFGYQLGFSAAYRGYSDLKFNVSSPYAAIIVRRDTKETSFGFGYIQAKSGLTWNNSILYVDPLRFKTIELEMGSQIGWMFLDEDRSGLNLEFGPRWGFGRRGHILTYQLSLGVTLGGRKK
jgi:hypothetical protein